MSLPTAQLSMIRPDGFAFAMSWGTSLPPFAPVMLVIPRRGRGVAGEGPGSLGQLIEGPIQLVGFPPLGLCLLNVGFPVVPLVGFQGGDQLGIDPARHVFRRDPTAPPDGSV